MATNPQEAVDPREMPSVPIPRVRDVNGARLTEDGGDTVVDLNPVDTESPFEAPPMGPEWHANLADQLSPTQRKAIADTLLEYIDVDKEARKHHFERLRQGLELLGLEDLPEGDVPFDGAATVTDPLIGEAVVQFSSRAIEELMPATGPVKAQIVGQKTSELEEQAERIEDYMNYQLTTEDEGYFWDVDQMLFWLPISGSMFKKVYPDPITGMTTARYVTAEDFIVPYYAKDLKSASRYAHEFKMQGNDVKRAQVDGYYLEDVKLTKPPVLNENTNSSFSEAEKERLIDDREPTAHEDDEVYTFYEYHIDYDMPFDDPEAKNAGDVACPYIITIEKESREVLSVRRNWKKGDRKYQKRIWFVHYKFFPGLGFYGFGYLHIIGALARATSGSLRAILDTAAMANMPGGFKSKKLKVAGEHRFTLGEWKDVDCSPEDLQAGFLPHPVKEPSVALANTYQNLVQRGKEFASVSEVMTGDADNKGPVGTTLALIEQASKPQSAIHKRLHAAMRYELKLMGELNFEFMERDAYPYQVAGDKRQVLKQDFDGRVDIIPVSDPNIFSNTQRIAIAQGTLELVKAFPHQFGYQGEREAVRRMLKALRTPEIDALLPESQPKNLDPVTENQYMATGKPVTVMPTQDDDAHMAVHQMFAQELAVSDPELFKLVEPAFMSHRMEHIASRYRKIVEAQLGMELPPMDPQDPQQTESLPPEIEVMISQAVAAKMRMQKRAEDAARGGPPPTPEQAEANAIENQKDAETVGKLERQQAEHREKQRQAKLDFEEQQRQEREAFLAEQKRLDEANRAEIERANKKADADVANTEKTTQAQVDATKKVASARAMVRPPASRSSSDGKRKPKAKKT